MDTRLPPHTPARSAAPLAQHTPRPWRYAALWLLLSLAWCALLGVLHARHVAQYVTQTHALARTQAQAITALITDVRTWNATHGGVYVPQRRNAGGVQQEPTPLPNPWLPEEKRTLRTADGQTLVLVNPAYMSRQIGAHSAARGIALRLASQHPLRPDNAADFWESAALDACAAGEPDVFTPPLLFPPITDPTPLDMLAAHVPAAVRALLPTAAQPGAETKGQATRGSGLAQSPAAARLAVMDEASPYPNYRYFAPLYAQAPCLTCHTDTPEGALRGGLSIRLNAAPLLDIFQTQRRFLDRLYAVSALCGVPLLGIGVFWLYRRRRAEVEQDRLRAAYWANMSHDMRTPLAGIVHMTELLRSQPQPAPAPEQRHALDYLDNAAGTLLEIVDDITSYSALEGAHPALETLPFSLRGTVRRCCALFEPQCQRKGLPLRVHIDDTVPDAFVGSAFRLRQMLGNLLHNAVKYTPSGEVRLSVCLDNAPAGTPPCVPDSPPAGGLPPIPAAVWLRFAISDTGPGIPDADQQHVFQRFARLHHASTGQQPGTGLGLPIVQQLVTLMGGSIRIISPCPDTATPDAPGTCFELRLPLTLNPLPNAPRAVTVNACDDLAGLRVFLLEDDPPVRLFIQQTLKNKGVTVISSTQPHEALQLLQRTRNFDVMLVDMHLPQMDGPTFVRAAQDMAQSDGVALPPLLTMSADVSCADVQRLRTLGVQQVLRKPFSAARLCEKVRRCAARASGDHGAPVATAAAPSSAVADTTADAALAAVRRATHDTCFRAGEALQALDGDFPLLLQLVRMWLDDAPAFLRDMRRAIDTGALADLRRLAHSCKNAAGTLYLPQVHTIADQLERAVDAAPPPSREALSSLLDDLTQAHHASLIPLQLLLPEDASSHGSHSGH